MRKGLKAISMVLAVSLALVGCNKPANNQTTNNGKTQTQKTEEKKEDGFIALLTDFGNIDDKSFNEASWKAIEEFCKNNNYKKCFVLYLFLCNNLQNPKM